jgi:hypothetical protein
MPYALFEGDDQLSRAYPTEAEVWSHADEAGLIDKGGKIERLEDDFSIKPCAPDTVGEWAVTKAMVHR